MPDDVIIRPATENDLEGVVALYGQPGLDDGVVLSPPEARAIFARFATYPSYTLYVAEFGGAVVGTFALPSAIDVMRFSDVFLHCLNGCRVARVLEWDPERRMRGLADLLTTSRPVGVAVDRGALHVELRP